MSATGEHGFGARDWSAHPPYLHPPYRSTLKRAPGQPLVALPPTASETTGPVFARGSIAAPDADLTRNARRSGEPLGERIIVTGRMLDEDARPVRGSVIEIWQANAAGRYAHDTDRHDAPLDPNFVGAGRCLTDDQGRYRFVTVRPGAYPWKNHANAWRPSHIHLSMFGPAFATRLVTQLYFPGDPLLPFDPIYAGVPKPARERLVARFSLAETEAGYALGYEFDIVLRGRAATPRHP